MLLMMSWREAGEIKAYLCQGLAEGASPREPLQRWLLHSLLSVAVPRHDRQSSLVMSSALDSFGTLLLLLHTSINVYFYLYVYEVKPIFCVFS